MAKLLNAQQSKRLVALAMGPALYTLGLDTWLSHFAGRAPTHWSQGIPVYYGAIGGTLLVLAGLLSSRKFLTFSLNLNGAVGAYVGLAGTYYHMKSLIENLGDNPVTMSTLLDSISVAPPTFAPGAFAGLGGAFLLMGLDIIKLAIRVPGLPAAADEGALLAPRNVARLEDARRSAAVR